MTEDTKTLFRTEGQPAFPTDTENDNSAGSSTEKTTEDQTHSDEGGQNSDVSKDGQSDKGFADHPAWKEREESWKKRFNEQESRHTQELTKLREDVEGKIAGMAPKSASETAVKIPSWFGGTDEQWAEFQSWNKSLVDEARAGAVKEISGREAEEAKRIDEATKYFEREVAEIEDDKELNPDGMKIDRNKILLVAQKFDLVNSKGQWNYRAAWQFLKNQKGSPADTTEKKKLAGATVSGDRSETQAKKFMTSDDFKKPGARPW